MVEYRQRRPWTQERVRAIRDRGWSRYVHHFGHSLHPDDCRYGSRCQISYEQNRRDAILASIELALRPVQTDLGLFPAD